MMKTTLTIGREIYKAAKRVAIDYETTLSEMVRKGLLIYISDPEAVEDTVALLKDAKAVQAIQEGKAARQRGQKDYYLDWNKVHDL